MPSSSETSLPPSEHPSPVLEESLLNGALQRRVEANGIEFHVLEWQPSSDVPSRGLVVASHGFPDHAPTFRHLGPALADRGFRVVAPFLRGYAPSAVTPGPYAPSVIGMDVAELASVLREEDEPLFLVGHDWGASATYLAAAARPESFTKIATLAVPFGGFLQALLENPEQQRRSWYMFFFQWHLAEKAIAHDQFAFIARLRKDWSPGLEEVPEEAAALRALFARRGVLEATLGYYRDFFNPPHLSDQQREFAAISSRPVKAPCLYLHGAEDGCIGTEVMESMPELFSAPLKMEVLENVGHFLHLEATEAVNQRIIQWFEN